MTDVKTAVEKLPEIYQVIYNHSEYDGQTSRSCIDREKIISKILVAWQKCQNKNNIKLLDIGCAQGYYSFKAFELGCNVYGIDFLEENINCCQAINNENNFNINFDKNILTKEYAENLQDDEFDVVLLLNVMHHIAHAKGFKYAQELLEILSKKSKIIITEMVMKHEPLPWNKNLPNKYTTWFDNIKFYKELSFFDTHLSINKRPLLIVSENYYLIDDHFYEIEEYKTKSFEGRKFNSECRYYFNDNIFTKYFRKSGNPVYYKELMREKNNLEKYSDISFFPKLLKIEETTEYYLIQTEIEKGVLLWDKIKAKEDLDNTQIVLDLFDNLIELENKNLYSDDIRSWNVVLLPDRAKFIDIGTISQINTDCSQHVKSYQNFFVSSHLAMLAFIYDLVIQNSYPEITEFFYYKISCSFDFDKLDQFYTNFFKSSLLIEPQNLNFLKLKEIFNKYVVEKQNLILSPTALALLEQKIFNLKILENEKNIAFTRISLEKDIAETNRLRDEMNKLDKEASMLRDEKNKLRDEMNKLDKEASVLRDEINELHDETNKIVDTLAWWIPVRKWRDKFRAKFE